MRVPDSLQKKLPERSLLIGFDVETTGLKGQIVEFSFWCAEGHFTRRCRPTCSMHPRAERAHGISLSELQTEELYQTVALECQAFLASLVRRTGARTLVLVGHNLSFDLRILQGEARRTGVSLLPANCPVRRICTLELARRRASFLRNTFPEGEPFNLELVTLFFVITGKRLENAHSALADARASLLVLLSGVLTVDQEGFVKAVL